MDTSLFSLLPEDHEEVIRFERAVADVGGSTNLLLLLEGAPRERLIACADELAPALVAVSGVERADYRAEMAFLERHGLLFLDPTDLRRIDDGLREEGDLIVAGLDRPSVAASIWVMNEAIASGRAPEAPLAPGDVPPLLDALHGWLDLIERQARTGDPDPGPEIRRVLARLVAPSSRAADAAKLLLEHDGYYLGPDEASLLIVVGLDADPIHAEFGFELYDEVRRRGDAVAARHGVTIGYAGNFAAGAEDQRVTLDKVQLLTALTFVVVIALFVWALRSRWAPLLVGGPLLLGLAWTFGMVRLVLGEMTLTGAIFGIALFGLGVDFAIHILFRLGEEVDRGRALGDGVRTTLRTTGRGVIVGGLTTAIAFAAMNISDFRGAQHLGTTTALGMLCCLVAFTVFMPALIVAIWGRRAHPPLGGVRLAFGPIDAVVAAACRRPWVTLAAATAVTAALAVPIRGFSLAFDFDGIIQRGLPSVETGRRIEQLFGATSEFAIVPADDIEQAADIARRLRARPTVARVESPSDLIPEQQAEKLPLVRSIAASARDLLRGDAHLDGPARRAAPPAEGLADELDRLGRGLTTLAFAAGPLGADFAAAGARATAVAAAVRARPDARESLAPLDAAVGDGIRDALRRLAAFGDARRIGFADLPAGVRAKLRGRSGRFAVLAHPADPAFNAAKVEAWKRDLRAVSAEATALQVVMALVIDVAIDAFPRTVAAIVGCVVLLLLLDLRSVRLTGLAMIPLVFGAVAGFGATCLLSPAMTVLMVAAFPLVFGIGIDDGIHLIHRFREHGETDVRGAVAETGKAIFFTSLTTALGFGCLLLSGHPGLEGLGLTVMLGVVGCFVASITVLPAVLELGARRRRAAS